MFHCMTSTSGAVITMGITVLARFTAATGYVTCIFVWRINTQLSSINPGTRSNSRRLLLTRVKPSLRACAAIGRSLMSIG